MRCSDLSNSPLPVSADGPEDHSALLDVASQFGLAITSAQAHVLGQYCRLLWDWNSRLNLTRHTTVELFVTRDLLDSIELAKHLPNGAQVLDVGSGGGVPGIVLAILRPDLCVSLSESVQKKARVLQDIVQRLELSVPIHAERAQATLRTRRFSHVVIRAVAPISELLTWFEPDWISVGELLLIKGPRWVGEQSAADAAGLLKRRRLEVVSTWPTPGREHDSVLLRIT